MDICDAASARQVEGTLQLDKVFSVSEKCRSHCFEVLAGKSFASFNHYSLLQYTPSLHPTLTLIVFTIFLSVASEDQCLFTPGNKSTNSFIPTISA